MKLLHHVWVTVYSKPEDDEQVLVEKLKALFPFNLEEEKIQLKRKTTIGFEEKKIIVLQIHIEKTRHLNAFLKNLTSQLSKEQKELLLRQKESRLDFGNHFFIRFDKPKMLNDEHFIVDHGNCFHVKMTLAAFPATREKALKIVEEILK